jgi:hypothetical protein
MIRPLVGPKPSPIKGGAKIENSELTDHNTALVGQTRVAKLMRVAEAAKDFLGKGESHV